MNFRAMFVSALLITLAIIFAVYILRRREMGLSRCLPSLLELSVPLFLFGLAVLPEAFPSIFANILHHSINSEYVNPTRADQARVTENWIVARWWMPIGSVIYVTVFIGIIWAGWNIFRGQDRWINIFAICLGLLWTALGVTANLKILPF